MAESLDEKFPYPLDMVVYHHFPGDSLDYQEVKALVTILWIIKCSNGVNEIDCFDIAKRVMANYGSAFNFDEREVAWAIIRLIEKGILSSVFMAPVEVLSIRSSTIPGIKIAKVNNDELIADTLNYSGSHRIIRRLDHPIYLKSRNVQQPRNIFADENRINLETVVQSDVLSCRGEYKN
jgi:hypothetical protein